jgi:hypothetical protein
MFISMIWIYSQVVVKANISVHGVKSMFKYNKVVSASLSNIPHLLSQEE